MLQPTFRRCIFSTFIYPTVDVFIFICFIFSIRVMVVFHCRFPSSSSEDNCNNKRLASMIRSSIISRLEKSPDTTIQRPMPPRIVTTFTVFDAIPCIRKFPAFRATAITQGDSRNGGTSPSSRAENLEGPSRTALTRYKWHSSRRRCQTAYQINTTMSTGRVEPLLASNRIFQRVDEGLVSILNF